VREEYECTDIYDGSPLYTRCLNKDSPLLTSSVRRSDRLSGDTWEEKERGKKIEGRRMEHD
jgi:hypothetical protein